MINILVVDDHPILREGIKQIVSNAFDITVVDEACNGFDALKKIQYRKYDVILLDISLPDISGIDVLKQIMNQDRDQSVLILSILPELHYASRILKAGASGYLTKDSAPQELIKAIRKVASKGKYISPFMAEQLASDLTSDKKKIVHEKLSDREFQVMCMIASGKTVSEVAEELFLSVKTISTYRTRILEKMNLKNNSELTHYAYENNLLDGMLHKNTNNQQLTLFDDMQ